MYARPEKYKPVFLLQILAGGSFFVFLGFGLFTVYQVSSVGLYVPTIIGLVLAFVLSMVFGHLVSLRHKDNVLQLAVETRADREAEKYTKIDTMLRGNSRIPKVSK